MQPQPNPPRSSPAQVLRALRAEQGWTLSDVSKRTGFTISTLSKIENGKMALTYDKMMRICTGLNIDIGVLFAAPTTAANTDPAVAATTGGRRSITRRGEGHMIETRNQSQQYPAADLLRKQIVPIISDIKARSRAEFGDLLRHPGEEYVLVLEGTLELHSELYAPVRLEVGDSIYFDSSTAHGYVAVGEGICRILSICSTVGWGNAADTQGDHERGGAHLQIVHAREPRPPRWQGADPR